MHPRISKDSAGDPPPPPFSWGCAKAGKTVRPIRGRLHGYRRTPFLKGRTLDAPGNGSDKQLIRKTALEESRDAKTPEDKEMRG